MKITIRYSMLLLVMLLGICCRKDWLDAKPDKSLVVPSRLEDYQALLDNSSNTFNANQPTFGELGAGDFYVHYDHWISLYTYPERYAYLWASDIYGGGPDYGDWSTSYQQVFYANVVLEGIEKIKATAMDQAEWNNIKGSALFYRAYAFYNLVQAFAKPYDSTTAASDLGIPIRLSSDVKIKSVRATVQQSYEQVINDLLSAKELLPVNPKYKMRPSQPAVDAMLARTYLAIEDYDKALAHAGSALQLKNGLMDFNTLDSASQNPIPVFNEEDMFYSILVAYSITFPDNLIVDSVLYQSYSTDDLRRTMFFFNNNGNITFRGSYSQNRLFYGGLATDELYLTRAECYARKGNITASMLDLNTLLQTRWKTGTFIPFTATTPGEALSVILTERHKELVFRGIHWNDLRRLNKDPRFAVTLTRELNGQIYTLPPGDKRYVFPIPDDEIKVSGITQNDR